MKNNQKELNFLEEIERYGESDFSRFHTPGHNGELKADSKYDITEVNGLPFLYSADGKIRDAEREFAKALSVGDVYFSTHGATLAILAMLYTTVGFSGKMVAGRNIHRSVVNAATLLDIEIEFIYPTSVDGILRYSPADAKKALTESKANILYLTSPDYYGNICDIKAFVEVAKSVCGRVIVDNAHGSHLAFQNNHPMQNGAFACVDSFHKTLPSLTGAAALLFAEDVCESEVKDGFALFGSTSPNFMILRSILKLKDYFKTDFTDFLAKTKTLRLKIEQLGFLVTGDDKTRIALNYAKSDIAELHSYFLSKKVMPELLEEGRAVFILKSTHRDSDFERLYSAACDFPFTKSTEHVSFPYLRAHKNCSIREAMTAKSEIIDIDLAIGRTAAEIIAPCPPGIPVVIPGENVCEKSVKFLKKCGITKLKVIK